MSMSMTVGRDLPMWGHRFRETLPLLDALRLSEDRVTVRCHATGQCQIIELCQEPDMVCRDAAPSGVQATGNAGSAQAR